MFPTLLGWVWSGTHQWHDVEKNVSFVTLGKKQFKVKVKVEDEYKVRCAEYKVVPINKMILKIWIVISLRYVEYDVVPVNQVNGIMLKKSLVTLAKSQFKVQVMVKIESTSLQLNTTIT